MIRMTELVFLKLGGSLITDKTLPYTPRLEKLADLALSMPHLTPGMSMIISIATMTQKPSQRSHLAKRAVTKPISDYSARKGCQSAQLDYRCRFCLPSQTEPLAWSSMNAANMVVPCSIHNQPDNPARPSIRTLPKRVALP